MCGSAFAGRRSGGHSEKCAARQPPQTSWADDGRRRERRARGVSGAPGREGRTGHERHAKTHLRSRRARGGGEGGARLLLASVCLSSREALVRVDAARGSDGDGAAAKSAERAGCEVGLRRSMRIRSAREKLRAGGATRGEVVVARNGMSWFANRSQRKKLQECRDLRRRRETVMPARERRTQKRGVWQRAKRSKRRKGARGVSVPRESVGDAQTPRFAPQPVTKTSIADGWNPKSGPLFVSFSPEAPDQSNEECFSEPLRVWGGARFTTRHNPKSGRAAFEMPLRCAVDARDG